MAGNEQAGWQYRLIRENPALVLSGMYLIASVVGLLYSWIFLRMFDVNFFRYAEIGDFLLASLKEPFTWVVAIGTVLLVLMDNASSRRVEARGAPRYMRWYACSRYRQVNFLVAVLMLAIFLYFLADRNSQIIREGETDLVDVQLVERPGVRRLAMLGTTGRFVILYDSPTSQVYIYPHESILEISKRAPDRR